ncbi:MAG: hypothetical protein HOE90_22755 [Bacteriovoracaceae bacterium]|jgi:hypothetical protein|nr:hypothetical protein [Bacteriovoracaceae bacterium]
MKSNNSIVKLTLLLFIIIFEGCSGSDGAAQGSGGQAPEASINSPQEPEATNNLPKDAFVLLSSHSGETVSESVTSLNGTIVNVESNIYNVLMSLPEYDQHKIASWTRNGAGSNGYTWGLTQNGKIYTVKTTTSHDDSETKWIREINPNSGQVVSECRFNNDSAYGRFTLKGNEVFFFSSIRRDLYGNITSGGNLTKKNCDTGVETSLSSFDKALGGVPYFAGNKLLMVSKISVGNSSYYFIIREVSQSTGVTLKLWHSFYGNLATKFSSESDGIYWATSALRRSGDYNVSVNRISTLKVDLGAEYLFNDTASDSRIALDVEDGKVLLVTKSDQPIYQVFDVNKGTLEQMDVDSRLYSTLVNGNAEFMIAK